MKIPSHFLAISKNYECEIYTLFIVLWQHVGIYFTIHSKILLISFTLFKSTFSIVFIFRINILQNPFTARI